jgi:hypothetical protein
MDINIIPNRASDAGPDTRALVINRQSLYSLLTEEVTEHARELERCYVDTRKDEQRKRLEVIQRAIDSLEKLREVV